MMILLTQRNGPAIRGEIEKDLGDEIIFDSEVGRLIIKKEDIAEEREILNCTRFKIGTYVQANDGIYLKIGEYLFRRVRDLNGRNLAAIDTDRIDFGKVLTHEEVFPPEEEEVLPEEEVIPPEEEVVAEPEGVQYDGGQVSTTNTISRTNTKGKGRGLL